MKFLHMENFVAFFLNCGNIIYPSIKVSVSLVWTQTCTVFSSWKFVYCISANSFFGNYSFLNLEITENSNSCLYWKFWCDKLFKGGNYSRVETILLQCILSIFPAGVHQWNTNIFALLIIDLFFYSTDQFALGNTVSYLTHCFSSNSIFLKVERVEKEGPLHSFTQNFGPTTR